MTDQYVVRVTGPRSCHRCGWTLADAVEGYAGPCPGCIANDLLTAEARESAEADLAALECSLTTH